ncbi:MAG: hypothetical protein LUE64_01705 [Candidatus Gastranaerophilales bacterium]|nr:hypothetical protein [Candidatus Gastranaerophilales bacterium]
MNYIFVFLILVSIVTGALTGRLENVINEMFSSLTRAVEIAISLIGIMSFWLGLVKIAQKSGLIQFFSKLISPLLCFIFNELPKNSPAFSNIALNISANAFGLANAATPFGIKAMKDLKKENTKQKSETATNSMCLFLAMNTAGFQLVPAAVLAILALYGNENPSEIIMPAFIVTFSSFIFAIFISKILARFWKEF